MMYNFIKANLKLALPVLLSILIFQQGVSLSASDGTKVRSDLFYGLISSINLLWNQNPEEEPDHFSDSQGPQEAPENQQSDGEKESSEKDNKDVKSVVVCPALLVFFITNPYPKDSKHFIPSVDFSLTTPPPERV